MRNPKIDLRIEPKWIKLLEREAKHKEMTIPALIRQILKTRYTRKVKAKGFEMEDLFSGPPRRQIKTFEDLFSTKT